jgi:hypothetical protein
MDTDSKIIRKFVSRFQKKYKRTFSKESRVFIHKMFYYLKQGFDAFSKITIQPETLKQVPTGEYYHLLEPAIKTAIENQLKTFQKMTFSIGNRHFDIYMSFMRDGGGKIGRKWIQYIYMWLHIANHFAVPSCSTHLSIYLYYTDLKKTLPDNDGQVIEADHANTAFTFACNLPGKTGKNEIYVYRLEEWFKVFVHETIHSFAIDFAAMNQTDVQSRITKEIYKVPCHDLRFYESYTETWAELIQSMFAVFIENLSNSSNLSVSNHHDNNNNSDEKLVLKFEEYIGYEAAFSAFQCVKVLDHFGLAYSDLFNGAASHYKESTPVFAYYVIKSVFMNHADDYIRWTMENNQGSLQFKKTATNINKLADLLKTFCQKNEYLAKMDEMDVVLDGTLDHVLLGETMRMSCVSFI